MDILEFDNFMENSNKEIQDLEITLKDKFKEKDLILQINTLEAIRQKAKIDSEILNIFNQIKQKRFLQHRVKLEFKPIIMDILNTINNDNHLDYFNASFKKQYTNLYDL